MKFNQIIIIIGLSLLFLFQQETKAQTCATNYDNPWEWASHATWFTGNGVFINFPGGTGAPVVSTKAVNLGDNTNHAYEGTAAFSDNNGDLIGWSNGRKLWRADGGDGVLVADDLVAGNENGSVGERSSAVQGIVAVRHPNIPEKIFILTSDDVLSSDIGPHYVVYDIITQTSSAPIRLLNDVGGNYRSSEQIDATFHGNGNDIWVVIRQSGRGSYNNFRSFYSYLITCDGLNPVPVKSNEVVPELGHTYPGGGGNYQAGIWSNDYGRGALKISWDGTKAATGNHITGGTDADEALMVFDFDNFTGLLSNAVPFARSEADWGWTGTNWGAAYDIEWAPDSRGLYVSSISGSGALQWFDTQAGSSSLIHASGKTVTTNLTQFRDVKLGGDGNLYATGTGSTLRQYTFASAADLNTGTGVTVNSIPTGAPVSLGLSNTFIPPIDYTDLSVNPTIADCSDPPLDLSVTWFCQGGNAEDVTVNGWSSNCGPCITDAANGIFDPSIAGAGTHRIYYQRGTACSQIDSMEITVSCGPCEDTTLSNVIAPLCVDEIADLSSYQVTGDAGTWSIVSTPAGSSPATITGGNTFDAANADAGTYRIRFTLNSAPISACPDSAERDIVVNALPTISLSTGPICSGETLTLDAGNAGASYQWSTGGVNGGSGRTEDVTTAGPHKVVVTLGTGCVDSATTTVVVNANPDVSITPPSVSCTNEDPEILVGSPVGGTWYINEVLSITGEFHPGALGNGTHEIKYEFVDGNGCSDIDSIDHTVNTAPSVSIDQIGVTCSNEAIETMTASPIGGIWYIDNVLSTDQFDPSINIGSNTIKYSYTNGAGCSDSTEVNVNINTAPVVTIDPISASCDNEAVETLTASPAGGNWFINDLVSTDQFDPSVLGAAIHEVKYAYTDVNGCSDSDSVDVTINAAPSVTIDPISVTCSNEAIETMTAAPVGGDWYINTVLSTDQFDPSVNLGNNTIKYSYTNGAGCSDSTELNVNINTAPDVVIDPVNVSCDNEAVETLTASPAGGNWFINDLASTDQFDPSVLGAATHEVKYAYTDVNGCSDSDSVDVTINAAPSVSIDPISVTCSNEAIETMTAAPVGGNWYINTVLSTDQFDPSVNIGNNTIKYSYTNGAGCSDSTELNVNINTAPDVVIDPISASCDNHLTETMSASPAGGNWFINDLASTDQFDPMTLGAATHEVKYAYTDVNGCSDSDSVDVTINAIPVVTAIVPNQFCQNEGGVIFTGSPLGGSWLVNGSSETSPFAATDGIVGNNDVEYIYVDGNGCTDTARNVLEILSAPTASIDASNTVWCTNADVTLTGQPGVGVTYAWDQGGLSSSDQIVTVAGTGPYRLIVEDANTCKDTTEISFTAQLPNPDLGADQNVCTGFETTLDPGTFVSYSWDDGSSDPTRDVVAGFQVYWVDVTDAEGCTNRAEVEFTQRIPFTVEIEGDSVICAFETTTLTAVKTPSITGGVYEWQGASGSDETAVASVAGLVKVIVTDDANCVDSAEINIEVNDLPVVSFGLAVDSFCSVGRETYEAVLSVNGSDTYQNLGDDYYEFSEFGELNNNRATYAYAPTVVLGSYTDINGCSASDTLKLMEYCEPTEIILPNVFVPGGGVTGNSTFRPINMTDDNFIELVNNIVWSDFQVYNRWGIKVYQSENLMPNWDGMFENQPTASGTYYWIYKYKDSSQKIYNMNGFVQILQQRD